MVKLAEGPTYSWRTAPSSPNLKITSLEVGPDLDEGGSWRAIFSIRGRRDLLTPALEASYGGTGGPIDLNPIYHGRREVARERNEKLFAQVMEILQELAKRSEHAREFELDSVVTIMVSDMISDHEMERGFLRIINRGGLVGIRADDAAVTWDPYSKYPDVDDYCAAMLKAGRGKDVVEWVHETLGLPGGVPKPHEVPYVPEDELWKPPPDLPCKVCGEMIDRKECGTAARTCRGVMCESLEQEVLHGARDMVRLGVDKPPANGAYMRPSFFGHGCQGPIGGLIRLYIEIHHHEWPSEETLVTAKYCFEQAWKGFALLELASTEGRLEGDDRVGIKVPMEDELVELTALFPALLEAALVYEREHKDD